jgi:hypothetical protein
MKNSITLICCSVIISIGIGAFGYFIGKGIRESQPWHYLSNPMGFIENVEIPESLDLGFKINELREDDKRGMNFKLKIEKQAYEGQITGKESGGTLGGELKFDQIELSEF